MVLADMEIEMGNLFVIAGICISLIGVWKLGLRYQRDEGGRLKQRASAIANANAAESTGDRRDPMIDELKDKDTESPKRFSFRFPESDLLYELGGSSILKIAENRLAYLLAENAAYVKSRVEKCGIVVKQTNEELFPYGMLFTINSSLQSVINGFSTRVQSKVWKTGCIVSSPIGSETLRVFVPYSNITETSIIEGNYFQSIPVFKINSLLNLVVVNDNIRFPIVWGSDRNRKKPYIRDLCDGRSLMIVGPSGSGKSAAVDNIIISLIWRRSPDEIEIVIVSDAPNEYIAYENIPHLCAKVITDSIRYADCLKVLANEVRRRADIIASSESFELYNQRIIHNSWNDPQVTSSVINTLPYICLIVDAAAFSDNTNKAQYAQRREDIKFIVKNGPLNGVQLVYCTHSKDSIISELKRKRCTYLMLSQPRHDYDDWFENVDPDELPEAKGQALIISTPHNPMFLHLAFVSEATRRAIARHWDVQASGPLNHWVEAELEKLAAQSRGLAASDAK